IRGQDLDRDLAPDAWVAGSIDFAHAASADEADDLVRTEVSTRSKSHEPSSSIRLEAARRIMRNPKHAAVPRGSLFLLAKRPDRDRERRQREQAERRGFERDLGRITEPDRGEA